MDLEQLTKRVEWLDEERRKDKSTLVSLEDNLTSSSGNLQTLLQQVKELTGEVTKIKTILPRLDSIDEGLLKQKREAKLLVDNLDKELQRRSDEAEKVRRVEMGAVDASLSEVRKELISLAELKRNLQSRIDEETRIVRSIEDLKNQIEAMRKDADEFMRLYRLLEDGRRQDGKRLTDMQGELTASRKRMDEMRSQMEIISTDLRKIETRINEAETSEAERKRSQIKYVEEQTLIQVERERIWKEWQNRFDLLEKQTIELDGTLQSLDTTHNEVIRMKHDVEELSQKVERRIAEMAEIQRLSEERFHQEWSTNRADDQKRWTNYSLLQEEQRNEINRQNEKLTERISTMEETLQEIKDTMELLSEFTEKSVQSILAVLHDSVSTYERNLGHFHK